MSIQIGDKIPDLLVTSTSPEPQTDSISWRLSDAIGQWVILYFYPKDATPGCSTQAMDFRDMFKSFEELNVKILGVSRDSMRSHNNFKKNLAIPFELISDPDETLCNYFDVIKDKIMYGKTVRGIERSTFLFNPNGQLVEIWRKVKATDHAQMLLEKITQMQKNR